MSARAVVLGLGLGGAGCAPVPLEITAETLGCTDVDFTNPEPVAALGFAMDGPDALVWLDGVWVPGDAAFEPDFSVDGTAIDTLEAWSAGTEAETCRRPTLRIVGAPAGDYELRWTRPGDSLAWDTVAFTVE